MMDFLNWLRSIDPSTAALVVGTVIVLAVVISWHRSNNDFQLQQMLVDNVSGRVSIEKVGYMTALAIGSWGFIALTLSGKMTEGYFTAYLGVFALSRVASSGLTVFKDIKAPEATK
jgi:hypothetical protein